MIRTLRPQGFASLALAVGLCGAASAQFPIHEARSDDTQPRIAYDPETNQHLVVWDDGAGIQGRLINSSGSPAAPAFPIFSPRVVDVGEDVVYDQAAVTLKTSQNQFYVAARKTFRRAVGPGTVDSSSIVVRPVTGAGEPGIEHHLFDGVTGRHDPAHPWVVAGTFGSDCCILVAWQKFTSEFTNHNDICNDIWGQVTPP